MIKFRDVFSPYSVLSQGRAVTPVITMSGRKVALPYFASSSTVLVSVHIILQLFVGISSPEYGLRGPSYYSGGEAR